MRSLLFIFLPWLAVSTCAQQTALLFDDAKSKGILDVVNKTYGNALDGDSTKCVFFKHEKQFEAAYKSLLSDLNKFLLQKDFKWQKNVRCFNRIYFSANGKIDYFLYKFLDDQLDVNTKKMFQEILHDFIQNYRFPLQAERNFAQCSPVIYQLIN